MSDCTLSERSEEKGNATENYCPITCLPLMPKMCKKRHTNPSMAWIDYKKAYDDVSQSWIRECMQMFGIAENVRSLLKNSMEQWKLLLMSNDLVRYSSFPSSIG